MGPGVALPAALRISTLIQENKAWRPQQRFPLHLKRGSGLIRSKGELGTVIFLLRKPWKNMNPHLPPKFIPQPALKGLRQDILIAPQDHQGCSLRQLGRQEFATEQHKPLLPSPGCEPGASTELPTHGYQTEEWVTAGYNLRGSQSHLNTVITALKPKPSIPATVEPLSPSA